MKRNVLILWVVLCSLNGYTQTGLINTSKSKYALLSSVGMSDVQFTNGFWKDRTQVCQTNMVPHLWDTYTSTEFCFAFQNFKIAAGLDTGRFRGPSFHDGDFYKTLEAVAALYATTKDPHLFQIMEDAIAVIAKAQRPDGYVYTKSIIEQRKSGKAAMFDDKLSFEAYNFGHLMTAACIHYRATGKTNLLNIAKKATDFLISFYDHASPEQARNAICPSHYMGVIEMFRTTGDTSYLKLASHLIDIRGQTEGTDDNSDRLPFRQMTTVNGHAVRANYLFAGVADVYAETGDTSLLHTLHLMWDDVVFRKMYITGGCGALYDGLSQEAVSYKPDSIQKIQQAYGKAYQLPNLTAHNETCANIGNLLWNWRMLQISKDAKYADIMELNLYNSILSGISLDGDKFFYTNPLAANAKYPYTLRWSGGRSKYISKSNCCPPNIIRTIAEVNNYMYSIASDGLYVNLYSANSLKTVLQDGNKIQLTQKTAYPWDGKIVFDIQQSNQSENLYLRIPSWCNNYTVTINGHLVNTKGKIEQGYLLLNGALKKGNHITLYLAMPVQLMESNPLVENNNNQVAVKRGPIVYCLESADLKNVNLQDIQVPSTIQFTTIAKQIDHTQLIALNGMAKTMKNTNWDKTLYQPIHKQSKDIQIQLIPYFAWANRGNTDMSVWLPLWR
jgi:hypothetical protein